MVRGNTTMHESERGGPVYPNASTTLDAIDAHSLRCPSRGCLYNVVDDVAEEHEVGAEHLDLVESLMAEMEREVALIWKTGHAIDPACKAAAKER